MTRMTVMIGATGTSARRQGTTARAIATEIARLATIRGAKVTKADGRATRATRRADQMLEVLTFRKAFRKGSRARGTVMLARAAAPAPPGRTVRQQPAMLRLTGPVPRATSHRLEGLWIYHARRRRGRHFCASHVHPI